MQVHNLVQGSQAWQAYRAEHFNASDAPAMLGCSTYKSRSDLIAELATGLTAEIDSFTQKRFDDGHRYEALARPIAEGIIGATLYPVVGSAGKYSASFDGLTMAEDIGYEHKSLNEELRAVLVDISTVAPEYRDEQVHVLLPKMYRVQMEQQCMVSGAERILFMASKWAGEELVEAHHCWYTPNAALQAEIIAGWDLLEADVAAYVPAEPTQKLLAASFETLPAIAVQIKGEVTASNMDAFKERLAAYIASVKTDLVTDQDFVDADAAAKNCATIEKRLAATKEQVLGQVADIDAIVRALEDADDQVAKLRIMLEKEIKAKKELLKAGILTKAQQALKDHVAALEKEIVPITLVYQSRDFAGVMKGLRTIKTLQDAADTELAAGKITVDALAAGIRARQEWFKVEAAEYLNLFADLQTLIQKPQDDFKLAVTARITAQKAADDAKIEAARKDEAAKLELAAAKASTEGAELSPAAQVLNEEEGIVRFAAHHRMPAALATTPVEIEVRATAPVGPPTLKLGVICERLGFTVTADFLLSLGFAPAATEKNSKLFHMADFPLICTALRRHIDAIQAQF